MSAGDILTKAERAQFLRDAFVTSKRDAHNQKSGDGGGPAAVKTLTGLG